ncbi:MAG: phytoene dehydrogenase [Sulfuricurvum sp. 24-42-5]|nr:MAG: phytoene dehydrogenase [Sulfuricurvum sp. 24-42-5]
MIRGYAIIGGGIGGCSIAALLNAKGHDVVLIEKESSLGGCASTFSHGGNHYNAGATTISGYHEGGIVRRIFEAVGVVPDVISSDPAITIIQGDKTCVRYRDLERFISEIETFYPHDKHREFWTLVHTLGIAFYELQGHYYSNQSSLMKVRSLLSLYPMFKRFWKYLFGNAHDFITRFYGTLSPQYLDFLDAQILIVAQATSDKVNFFTAALSLGYTFNETHYPIGGMGAVCTSLTSKIPDVRTRCLVTSITKENDVYTLTTAQGTIQCKNLIMGTSHYESSQWFSDHAIKKYYQKYEKRNNHQSAFVLYMSIKTPTPYHHHYQLIAPSIIPNALSKAQFVSFSDPSDTVIAPAGLYRITASIHTDTRFWAQLSKAHYQHQKKELQDLLQQWICDKLGIQNEEIVECFAATPKTFGRYINRTQLGGNALTLSNLLPRLPSNDTPIKGLYQVGDTAYAAQGWPGVVMGAFNCMRMINGKH